MNQGKAVFPPSKNGGPIEALALLDCHWNTDTFPPSKNGGPIEAIMATAKRGCHRQVSAVKKRRPH